MTALPRPRPLARGLAAVATVLLATAGLVAAAEPAEAAPRVSISVKDRPELGAVADDTYLTELVLRGQGFQSIQNGFGGIYVLFGWAGSGWQPSRGGQTGSDYRYVYDDETNPVGYQLFVSFPGSSTAYAANGGLVGADGTWSATIKIPGPRFQAYDRSGQITSVDCLQTQCGIITVGAHGVVNASNESFTPLSFQSIYSSGEGRQVVSQGSAEPVALAPSVVGGRPATIPATLSGEQLDGLDRGEVTAELGATRLTVTVPDADPDEWLGVSLYSEPLFAGWFKPSSEGKLDIDLPGNLAEGSHRVVVVTDDDDHLGWAPFDYAPVVEAPDSADPAAPAAPGAQPVDDLTPLIVVTAAIGVIAVLAVVVFLVLLLRGRRRASSRTDAPAA